ncbi:hypothetical protein BVRB_039320 [Beta vulgaris subsp. vulgaris]|uniref:Uncharacterized protein n=1 Tax=Beta vulgaris subsp. vulgaris TaxID=3555 RepID=A0A0J7YNF6_BETVV|nr:hypothetical protein BVRB_039320 [Beta vulgaris subsp. vulgaris]
MTTDAILPGLEQSESRSALPLSNYKISAGDISPARLVRYFRRSAIVLLAPDISRCRATMGQHRTKPPFLSSFVKRSVGSNAITDLKRRMNKGKGNERDTRLRHIMA